MSSRAIKISIITLFILVLISLGLNGYLFWQLARARQQARDLVRQVKPVVQETLAQVDSELETFQESSIAFEVNIDQDFPVRMNVPFNETIDVPIQMTIPIQQDIETTVMMDPFQSGLDIPVDIDVPLEVDVPIDTVIPVTIDRTVAISTSVPVDVDFPVAVDVSDTEFIPYIERIRAGLSNSQAFIDRITAELER